MKKNLVYISLVVLALLGAVLTFILIGRARDFEDRVRRYDSVEVLIFSKTIS